MTMTVPDAQRAYIRAGWRALMAREEFQAASDRQHAALEQKTAAEHTYRETCDVTDQALKTRDDAVEVEYAAWQALQDAVRGDDRRAKAR